MKNVFYLINNGRTTAENRGAICGSTNSHIMTEFTKDLLAGNPVIPEMKRVINRIYVSEAARTLETAALIDEYCGKIINKHFNEINFGEYELYEPRYLPDNMKVMWEKYPDFHIWPGGDNVRVRATDAFQELKNICASNTCPFAVVSSKNIIALIVSLMKHEPLFSFNSHKPDNCQIIKIEYETEGNVISFKLK